MNVSWEETGGEGGKWHKLSHQQRTWTAPSVGTPPWPYFLFHPPPGGSQKMVGSQDVHILKLRITRGAWKNIDALLLFWSTISVAALLIQMQGSYCPKHDRPASSQSCGTLGSRGELLKNNLIWILGAHSRRFWFAYSGVEFGQPNLQAPQMISMPSWDWELSVYGEQGCEPYRSFYLLLLQLRTPLPKDHSILFEYSSLLQGSHLFIAGRKW